MCFLDFLFKPKAKEETVTQAPEQAQQLSQEALLEHLQALSQGLFFPSETDSPLVPVFWPLEKIKALRPENVLRFLDKPADTSVESQEVTDFFKVVTPVRDFFDERQREEAPRFQALVDFLQQNLEEVIVYRVGVIEIDAYVLGHLQHQGFVGVSILLVET